MRSEYRGLRRHPGTYNRLATCFGELFQAVNMQHAGKQREQLYRLRASSPCVTTRRRGSSAAGRNPTDSGGSWQLAVSILNVLHVFLPSTSYYIYIYDIQLQIRLLRSLLFAAPSCSRRLSAPEDRDRVPCYLDGASGCIRSRRGPAARVLSW